jgi:hypothetical protein
MAVIPGEIGRQAYELVGDRIAEILADELPNQFSLSTASADIKSVLQAEVYTERVVPFDKEEVPCVNVQLASGDYAGQTVKQADGTYIFFIDCYASAKNKDNSEGDVFALVKLKKLIGVIRAIIQDTRYLTLGYARGFVMNRQITGIAIANNSQQDAMHIVMGRLTLTVKVPETVELLEPTLAEGYQTTVKLYETEKGYLWDKEEY